MPSRLQELTAKTSPLATTSLTSQLKAEPMAVIKAPCARRNRSLCSLVGVALGQSLSLWVPTKTTQLSIRPSALRVRLRIMRSHQHMRCLVSSSCALRRSTTNTSRLRRAKCPVCGVYVCVWKSTIGEQRLLKKNKYVCLRVPSEFCQTITRV